MARSKEIDKGGGRESKDPATPHDSANVSCKETDEGGRSERKESAIPHASTKARSSKDNSSPL